MHAYLDQFVLTAWQEQSAGTRGREGLGKSLDGADGPSDAGDRVRQSRSCAHDINVNISKSLYGARQHGVCCLQGGDGRQSALQVGADAEQIYD